MIEYNKARIDALTRQIERDTNLLDLIVDKLEDGGFSPRDINLLKEEIDDRRK